MRVRNVVAAVTGGMLLGGIAVAPALAYPSGTALTVACDATTYAPGATATCTASNIDPAGPSDIVLGGKIASAQGPSFARASVSAQQAAVYTQTMVMPTTVGTYEVLATSGTQTATTTVQVVATGGSTAATTPQTGANVALGLAAGVGALAVGGGLYVASRRKRV